MSLIDVSSADMAGLDHQYVLDWFLYSNIFFIIKLLEGVYIPRYVVLVALLFVYGRGL